MKDKVREKTSQIPVVDQLGVVLASAFDAAMADGIWTEMNLDSFSDFVDEKQLEKLQTQHGVMQGLVELNTWEQIVKTSDVNTNVAAGDKFERWLRIDMKKLEMWKVQCLPTCKELLESFTKRAAEVSHLTFVMFSGRRVRTRVMFSGVLV